MNKKLLLSSILLLNSCAFLEYKDTLDTIKSLTLGAQDIKIDSDFLESRQYSFIKVKIGRSLLAIMSLSRIEGDTFTWVGQNNEIIQTKYGRIISTIGLSHDIDILNRSEINPLSDDLNDLLVLLENPRAIVELKRSRTIEKNVMLTLDNDYAADKYEVSFQARSFSWTGTNTYWFDQRSDLPFLPLKSITTIHPRLPIFEIDFYYKFL